MRIVFMVEESSMKELLLLLLPKIIPVGVDTLILSHSGKSDLQASIPKKLKSWTFPEDKFVIVHDQDRSDCIKLKEKLISLCTESKNEYLIRISCRELEAWYFGDLEAVSLAYGKDYTMFSQKQKYRNPDNIGNAKEEMYKLIPKYQPILGAQRIGPHMKVEKNTSHSFRVFVSGIKRITACC